MVMAVVLMIISFIAIAYAAGEESLKEHSVVIMDVMAYIIIALFTALVGLVLWNILDMKNTIRENHKEITKEMRKYVKIQIHNAICDHQIETEQD
jgi:H+/gluconate symporter-like permease